MRVFSLALLAASAIGAVSIGSAAAMPFANPASAQESLIQDVRVVCDRAGALHKYRPERMNWAKAYLAKETNQRDRRGGQQRVLAGQDGGQDEAHDHQQAHAQAEQGPLLLSVRPLTADGLVEFDGPRIVATSRGRLMLRIIAMCFDRYLPTQSASESRPRHSRAL